MNLKIALFSLYIILWTLLAYDPSYRDDWILENILVVAALPIVIGSNRRFGFSNASAWMLFLFFLLHTIGAHYTYSEMPWFSPITDLFGFERNHYDRLIHFLFGLLLFLPFYELFNAFQHSKRTALTFTFVFLIAASGVYEVAEWVTTEITHAELGIAFLGTQGDPWDSQKDMACAFMGAAIAFIFWYRRFLRV